MNQRTLRWHVEFGIVVPGRKPHSDCRFFRGELLKDRQQTVFLRELGFPLARIKVILTDPRSVKKIDMSGKDLAAFMRNASIAFTEKKR